MALAHERSQVKLYPTALASDILFYELYDDNLPANKQFEYGDPHPNTGKWPDHELVYVDPERKDGFQKRFYAALRDRQDEYNWNIGNGEQLIRTYFIKREDYYGRSQEEIDAESSSTPSTEFGHPAIGQLDSRFSKYGFADDTVIEAPEELRSLYIVVKRRFIQPIIVEFSYDESLERTIKITKELIPANQGLAPTQSPGVRAEIQNGNSFHDVLITREIMADGDGSGSASDSDSSLYPYEIRSIPTSQDMQFPQRLDFANMLLTWAIAAHPSSSTSYSEQWYIDYELTKARPGPYEGIIRRFITDNPEEIKVLFPLDRVPSTKRESLTIAGWWWSATDQGNSTSATCREELVPESIHEHITITLGGRPLPDVSDPLDPTTGTDYEFKSYLVETPGYTEFVAKETFILDHQIRRLPLGLYEVSVVIIDIDNLYPPPNTSDE